jgi:4-amino-4-deoxy-L-arabinose transferase-like glycosyltransferase
MTVSSPRDVRPSTTPAPSARARRAPVTRFHVLAAGVLVLAAVNTFYRLDQEFVTEWDESIYAISAWEMLNSGEWIATTYRGEVDYYNAKPPLNTWLIALSFKSFGVNVFALRLISASCAWLSVLALLWWGRRHFGDVAALLSGLVLSTMFGFLYVHSGRTANTDAAYALVVLLAVIVLSAAADRRWQLLWLGPILAAAFLLRGAAVLLPLAIVAVIEIPRCVRRARERWLPLSLAAITFSALGGGWVLQRWQFDETDFFTQMIGYDLIQRSLEPLEGHEGSVLFYLDVLQKYHFEWLACALLAAVMFLRVRPSWTAIVLAWQRRRMAPVLATWVGLTLLIPTAMATKTTWYLNPFYPAFALCVGLLLARSLTAAAATSQKRRAALIALIAVTAVAAEARLAWRSWQYRDWQFSVQGVLMSEAAALAGQTVHVEAWNNADRFVVRRLIGAQVMDVTDWKHALAVSREGDYFVSQDQAPSDARFVLVRRVGAHSLYRRVDPCHRPARRTDCPKDG